MKPLIFIALLAISASLAASDTESLADAESVAQAYLTAFYHGDLRQAADLTHPEMLASTKRDFLQKAQSGVLDETPFGAYVQSMEFGDLLSVPPAELFIKIQELSRSAAPPGAIEAMKTSRITVIKSERVPDNMVRVTLNVSVPTSSGGMEQESPVYVKKLKDTYRVTLP